MFNHPNQTPGNLDLGERLRWLANLEPNDCPVISCYLDLTAGADACQQLLQVKAAELRTALPAAAQDRFDQALAHIDRWLCEAPQQAQGAALFAKDGSNEQAFTVVPLDTAVPCDLSYQHVPHLGPLVSINESRGRHLLLLIRRKWIQILEVDAHTEKVVVWSALQSPIHSSAQAAEEGTLTSSPFRAGLNGTLRQVEHLIRTRKKLPVVLAGEVELTELLLAELPRTWRARVIDTVSVGTHKTHQAAAAASRTVFARYREERSRYVVSRMMRGVRAARQAVAGVVASWQALQNHGVETLVLATDISQTGLALDAFTAGLQEETQKRLVSETNATPQYLLSDTHSELVRLAIQQDVDIELVQGDQSLRYLGGVGCLLRQSLETQVEHAPKPRAELRLVA